MPDAPLPDQPASAAVAEPPAPKQAHAAAPAKAPPRRDTLPPFRVLLHNDDHNDMGHVVRSIMQLAAHPFEQAWNIMLEAHESGVSLVTVCHLEKAELLREQFQSRGLTATIEPAE